MALGGVEAGGVETVAVVQIEDRGELGGVDALDPFCLRFVGVAAKARGAQALGDPVELGILPRPRRWRRLARSGVASDVPPGVETPDEQQHERDQEPRRIPADAAVVLAPSPPGEEETGERPHVVHGLEDGGFGLLAVGPYCRRRVHVAPGAVYVRERPRVRVASAHDVALLETAPLLDGVADRV